MTPIRIGAYDPAAWDGLVVSDGPGRGFGIRFAVERDGERAELYDLHHIVHEVGPCAPEGEYARVSFDTSLPFGEGQDMPTVRKSGKEPGLTVEWSRVGKRHALGRISIHYAGVLEMCGYWPWDWGGNWEISPSRSDDPVETPATDVRHHCRLTACSADECSTLDVHMVRTSDRAGGPEPETALVDDGEVLHRLSVRHGDRLYLSALLVDPTVEGPLSSNAIDPSRIDQVLTDALGGYESKRVRITGHWEGAAAAISNNLHWMVSVKPESGRLYTPAGRRWIFPKHGGGRDHWTVFCWDAFLNSLELALESSSLARETLYAVLETQYENGNIPNWRGRFWGTPDRSQPPVGSFVALKCFLRTGDTDLLEHAYPYLEHWSRWWHAPKGSALRRDGNGNGLFEWGCDVDLLASSPAEWENRASFHQMAAWESGQDDLPNWDDAQWLEGSETLDLESVDLNSLLALDQECLARIAREIGLEQHAVEHQTRYRNLVDRVNRLLWDEERGMYLDRFWDGRRSQRLSASNFYPLLAGIPSREQAKRLLVTLLDDSKFWGRFVLPTISRDDPAFSEQQYWRGTVWPPPNYLVYQGLRRYGFDEVAGELAASSADLFLRSWRDLQLCRENYDSRTGSGGGQMYQSWGPLFALMAVEEFIDVTPWDGLRIGTLAPPPASRLHNLGIAGNRFDVAISPAGLDVAVDDQTLLHSRDPLVLRNLSFGDNHLFADTLSLESVRVRLSLRGGDATATVDGMPTETAGEEIRIPAGRHRLEVRVPSARPPS